MDPNQPATGRSARAEDPALAIAYPEVSPDAALHYRKSTDLDRKTRRRHRLEDGFARLVFERVGPDAHVVDIPCGNGRFFQVFGAARRLTMLDLSENMLAAARHWIGARENTRILTGDIFRIPLPDGDADLCFCMRLFHHIDTPAKRLAALRELARVSRRFVALSFYNKNCVRYRRRALLGREIRGQYATYAEMVALARQAGLTPVERHPRVNLVEQQCLVLFSRS